MGSEYAHVIANLVFVLALILTSVYALKKFKLMKYTGNSLIKIMNVASIGTKEKVILLEVNNTRLLIGATPNHIETLYVFSENEVTEVQTTESKEMKKSFSEQITSLKSTLGC